MISITIKHTFSLILLCCTIANAFDCPEHCACITVQRQHSSYNHAKCTSLSGLRQIGRTATIQSLDCSNIGIAKLTNQLDKLTNLTQLDLSNNQLSELTGLKRRIDTLNLSHNRITSGKLSRIPSYVQHLNLSHNDITYIPLDFKKLIHLKTLELNGNPINCTCDTLDVRNWLTQQNVFMSHVVKCSSPLSVKGKPWLQIRQSDVCQQIDDSENELMLGDQPVLYDDDVNGSGNDNNEDVDDKSELDRDFIPLKTSKDADHVVTEITSNGADDIDGNEGSGDVDIDVKLPQTAGETTNAPNVDDLTTILSQQMIDHVPPTNTSNEEFDDEASGSGGGPILDINNTINNTNATILDESLFEDYDEDDNEELVNHPDSLNIFGNINGSDEHTTLSGILQSEIIEPPIKVTDTETVQTAEEVKENKAEIALPPSQIDANISEQPIKNDADETEQGQSTMILLIVLGIVLVGLLAFVIVKKRRSNSRNRREKQDAEAPTGTEMLDMDKSLLGKPKNGTNGNVEFIPLMGQKPSATTNGNHQKPMDEQLSKAQEPLLKKLNEPESDAQQRQTESIQQPCEELPVTESNNNNVVDAGAPSPSGRSPIPPYRRKPDNNGTSIPAVHNHQQQQQPLHNGLPANGDGDDDVFVPVSPRQGRYSPVYSPETGRVKIKLSEMPKPKTPMLVTRSRSNAGDIILTPDLNQSRNQ